MNFKTTYILAGVLGLVLLVFCLVLFLGPTKPTDSDWVFPTAHADKGEVKSSTIDRIEIERGSAPTIVFERDEDTKKWKMTEPHRYRVSHGTVESLVNQVLGARKEPDAQLSSDLKEWGLDSPRTTVTVKGVDGSWSLKLGAESTTSERSRVVYVLSSEQKQPLAVRKTSLDLVLKDVNDYRDTTLLADMPTYVDSVKLARKDGKVVELKKKVDNRWVIANPDLGDADMGMDSFGGAPGARPTLGVRSLLATLTGLRVLKPADFAEDNASDKDLADKHLDAQNADLQVTIKLVGGDDKAGRDVTLLIGKSADDKNTEVFARLANEKHVVKVPATGLEQINKVLDTGGAELRDRHLLRADLGQPDAVNLTTEKGDVLRFRENLGFWKLYRTAAGDKSERADVDTVRELIAALKNAMIEEFAEGDQKFDKTVSVSLWVNGIKKPEKKDADKDKKDVDAEPQLEKPNEPTVELIFGKPGDKTVLVRRKMADGSKELVARVPASLQQALAESPVKYLDHTLPRFTEQMADVTKDVTKLVVERGGQSFEIEKEAKDGKTTWKLTKPDDLKDRRADAVAIQNILRTLNPPFALKLEAEKVSDEDLDKKFGLKNPKVKVTITVTRDSKSEPHEYSFGSDTEFKGTKGVFGKEGKRDLVFVAPAAILDTLQGELLDPTVFQFTADKLKGLKLSGWFKVNGVAFVLDLERESAGNWKAKAPDGYALDPLKAENLAGTLANLKAVRFVTKDGPRADDKMFELSQGALDIEIALKDEAAPFKLTIGGPVIAAGSTEPTGYYAKTSKMAGVFVLPKEPWKAVLEKPGYFVKP